MTVFKKMTEEEIRKKVEEKNTRLASRRLHGGRMDVDKSFEEMNNRYRVQESKDFISTELAVIDAKIAAARASVSLNEKLIKKLEEIRANLVGTQTRIAQQQER